MKTTLITLTLLTLSLTVGARPLIDTADLDEAALKELSEERPQDPTVSHEYDESGVVDGPIKQSEEASLEELVDEYHYMDEDPEIKDGQVEE